MAETINITRTCRQCREETTLTVSAAGWKAWDEGRGELIQYAFPELDPGARELIMNGVCGACFDAWLGPEPDPDTDPDDDGRRFMAIIIGDNADDIEAIARESGYLGAERPGDDEPTPATATTDDRSPVANPGPAGVTSPWLHAGPLSEIHSRVLAAKTLQGEPATRGHLSAPTVDWPRCVTVIPAITSPLFRTEPNICQRPATVLASFTEPYLDACAAHRCTDVMCPVQSIGEDRELREAALASQVPVCGLHLPWLRRDEQRFLREVTGVTLDHVFHLSVIGVESAIGTAAEVFDLRDLT